MQTSPLARMPSWVPRQAAQPGVTKVAPNVIAEVEKILIDSALKKTKGRKNDAAILLGWGRNTLTRKIKELGI